MKYLFICCLLMLALPVGAQRLTIPASQFPQVTTPSNSMRYIMVYPSGGLSQNPLLASNATIAHSDLIATLSTSLAGTIGNSANVLTLGAKGGTNDDTAVLQSLFNVTGGNYYFPPTNYTVSGLNVTNGLQLLGYGATLKLKAGVTNTAILNWAPGVTNVLVQGFRFDGGDYSVANSGPTGHNGGVTNRMGINADVNSFGSIIIGCYFIGLDKGITMFGTGDGLQVFERGNISLLLCEGSSNYFGIYLPSTNAGFQVEYVTPLQFRMHDCTYGAWIQGGNIGLLGADITENWVGVAVDGASGINPAHGFINDCKINHNVFAGIAVYNVTAIEGEQIANNQILADGFPSITISNSAGVHIFGNNFGNGEVTCGANGVANSSIGPNYVVDNYYAGTYGAHNAGLDFIDWKAFNAGADSTQTTNLTHWGNRSSTVVGDMDPWISNPYQTNTVVFFPTNVIPLLPPSPNAEFLYHSNGQKTFVIRSTGLSWTSTNVAY